MKVWIIRSDRMNQEEKQQLRDHRVNLSFVQVKPIRIRWRGREVDRRSQSKRTKTVKTAFAEKQRDVTATDIYNNKFQRDATVCRWLFTAKLLYTFRVSSHPSSGVHQTVTAASGTGHSVRAITFRQRGLIRERWRKVVALTLWPVPEAAFTVWCTPDEGFDRHPKHVE